MLSRTTGWALAAALATALAVGAGWLWWSGFAQALPETPAGMNAAVTVGAASVPAAATPRRTVAGPEPRPPLAVDAAPDDTPPGLTSPQWATVLSQLQGRPDAVAERQRLAAYFGWADAVQRWRATPTDVVLARQVDAGLPARLAQREVSAAEARQLKLALLQTLAPDDATRISALQAFDASLPAPADPDPRHQAFAQAQAAVVTAWQALPASQRDPQALAHDLAVLRQMHFSHHTALEEPR